MAKKNSKPAKGISKAWKELKKGHPVLVFFIVLIMIFLGLGIVAWGSMSYVSTSIHQYYTVASDLDYGVHVSGAVNNKFTVTLPSPIEGNVDYIDAKLKLKKGAMNWTLFDGTNTSAFEQKLYRTTSVGWWNYEGAVTASDMFTITEDEGQIFTRVEVDGGWTWIDGFGISDVSTDFDFNFPIVVPTVSACVMALQVRGNTNRSSELGFRIQVVYSDASVQNVTVPGYTNDAYNDFNDPTNVTLVDLTDTKTIDKLRFFVWNDTTNGVHLDIGKIFIMNMTIDDYRGTINNVIVPSNGEIPIPTIDMPMTFGDEAQLYNDEQYNCSVAGTIDWYDVDSLPEVSSRSYPLKSIFRLDIITDQFDSATLVNTTVMCHAAPIQMWYDSELQAVTFTEVTVDAVYLMTGEDLYPVPMATYNLIEINYDVSAASPQVWIASLGTIADWMQWNQAIVIPIGIAFLVIFIWLLLRTSKKFVTATAKAASTMRAKQSLNRAKHPNSRNAKRHNRKSAFRKAYDDARRSGYSKAQSRNYAKAITRGKSHKLSKFVY